MSRVALLDVVRPYFFLGIDLGPGTQDILELLHVDEYDTAWDDDGVVVWGDARIDSDNPQSPVFSPSAGGGALASGDVGRFEWHNIVVHFRLSAARRAAGALPVAGITDPTVATVLNSLGPTTGSGASDFPSTEFRLELLFEIVTLKIEKLIGARLSGWVLVPGP
jgi:large repetitive protein